MLFFGSLARIFTSIQETGDTTMIIMYSCSTFANAIIAAQILYYWNVKTVGSKKKDKTKKKEEKKIGKIWQDLMMTEVYCILYIFIKIFLVLD